jgi:hypothetical protein
MAAAKGSARTPLGPIRKTNYQVIGVWVFLVTFC